MIVVAPTIAFADGRCFPTPYTPADQAPYCYLATRSNCNAIGCEWRFKKYRCIPGPYTPPSSAPFCSTALPQNCEAIGCEWSEYYAP